MRSASVSLFATLPEELHQSIRDFLDANPQWDQDAVFSAAVSEFLLKHGDSSRAVNAVFLETLFRGM